MQSQHQAKSHFSFAKIQKLGKENTQKLSRHLMTEYTMFYCIKLESLINEDLLERNTFWIKTNIRKSSMRFFLSIKYNNPRHMSQIIDALRQERYPLYRDISYVKNIICQILYPIYNPNTIFF